MRGRCCGAPRQFEHILARSVPFEFNSKDTFNKRNSGIEWPRDTQKSYLSKCDLHPVSRMKPRVDEQMAQSNYELCVEHARNLFNTHVACQAR
jgi:hypothetical protein